MNSVVAESREELVGGQAVPVKPLLKGPGLEERSLEGLRSWRGGSWKQECLLQL